MREIPADAWDGPGLGEWDLRALVGHTSRSLITVSTYLKTTAEREDITTPHGYYAQVSPSALEWTRRKWPSAGGRPAGTSATIPRRR